MYKLEPKARGIRLDACGWRLNNALRMQTKKLSCKTKLIIIGYGPIWVSATASPFFTLLTTEDTPFRGSRRHLAKLGKNNSENNGIA